MSDERLEAREDFTEVEQQTISDGAGNSIDTRSGIKIIGTASGRIDFSAQTGIGHKRKRISLPKEARGIAVSLMGFDIEFAGGDQHYKRVLANVYTRFEGGSHYVYGDALVSDIDGKEKWQGWLRFKVDFLAIR